jgi:hypothetical protein
MCLEKQSASGIGLPEFHAHVGALANGSCRLVSNSSSVNQLTRLLAREDFIIQCRHESYKSYMFYTSLTLISIYPEKNYITVVDINPCFAKLDSLHVKNYRAWESLICITTLSNSSCRYVTLIFALWNASEKKKFDVKYVLYTKHGLYEGRPERNAKLFRSNFFFR